MHHPSRLLHKCPLLAFARLSRFPVPVPGCFGFTAQCELLVSRHCKLSTLAWNRIEPKLYVVPALRKCMKDLSTAYKMHT